MTGTKHVKQSIQLVHKLSGVLQVHLKDAHETTTSDALYVEISLSLPTPIIDSCSSQSPVYAVFTRNTALQRTKQLM